MTNNKITKYWVMNWFVGFASSIPLAVIVGIFFINSPVSDCFSRISETNYFLCFQNLYID